MMKQVLFCSIVLFSIIFIGCPLKTETRIDDGSYAIPNWLPGNWVEETSLNGKQEKYCFMKVDDEPSKMIVTAYDEGGNLDFLNSRSLTFSEVNGKIFVSVYDKGSGEDKGFYIFLFRQVLQDKVEITPLAEGVVDYHASRSVLKSWLLKNMNNMDVYNVSEKQVFQKRKKM